MTSESAKTTLLAVWMIAVVLAGVSVDTDVPAQWNALITLLTVPPIVLRFIWRAHADGSGQQAAVRR